MRDSEVQYVSWYPDHVTIHLGVRKKRYPWQCSLQTMAWDRPSAAVSACVLGKKITEPTTEFQKKYIHIYYIIHTYYHLKMYGHLNSSQKIKCITSRYGIYLQTLTNISKKMIETDQPYQNVLSFLWPPTSELNRKPELPGFGGTGVFVPKPAILEPCSGWSEEDSPFGINAPFCPCWFYVVTTYQLRDKISGEPNSGLLFYVSCNLLI